MSMSVDNQQLITGDTGGTIYIWNINVEGDNSTGKGPGSQLLQILELHKDYGSITNLIPLTRPLSLYGLTANMQGYEPGDIKALQRQ